MSVKKPSRLPAFLGPRSIAVVILSIAAVGILIVAQQPAPVDASAAVAQPRDLLAPEPAPKTTPKARVQAKPVVARAEVKKTAAVARNTTTPATPVTPVAPATPAVLPASRVSSADTVAKAVVQESVPVTLTGCLVRDDETFRLKDTEGTDAPKSRSWKSGFLKKRSASIEILDAANRLRLATHVGERVTVTGALVEREMQARSLRRVAESCE
jgi:hypothetical protein